MGPPLDNFAEATPEALAPHIDLMHHPIQLAHPEWSPYYDDDPDLARITRRRFLEDQADEDILVMTAHFPLPSVGYVISKGDAFGFRYADHMGTVHGF